MSLSENMHFLIVDDVPSIRLIASSEVKKLGIRRKPSEAANVKQAKEVITAALLANDKVDFVLCDWEMPGETGLDFLKWVRGHSDFQKLPFMMVTTLNEKENILSAISSGANNYLIKPFESEDFARKVIEVWKKHRAG